METTEKERAEHQVVVHHVQGDRCATCWKDWPCLPGRLCRDVDTLVPLLREPTKAAAEGDWVCMPASWLTEVRAVLGE